MSGLASLQSGQTAACPLAPAFSPPPPPPGPPPPPPPLPYTHPAAGKLTLLQQLLPRLLARGHRVLIFSQFVEVGIG